MPEQTMPMPEESCHSRDLACGRSALLFWGLPGVALIVGADWRHGLLLWIPAFLAMGVACLVNAARCGRVHCYVTGPLFLLAAVYASLSVAHLVPMPAVIFLLSIVAVLVLAKLAEFPLGRYRKRA
ncbi:MAG: hypothetical protein ACRD3N_08750 [Terracidiphilus sp.]